MLGGGTLAFGSRSRQPRRRGCFACGRRVPAPEAWVASPSSDLMVAIQVEGVSKRFRLHRGRRYFTVKDLFVRGLIGGWRWMDGDEHWALPEGSFEVPQGKMVGIIGSTRSGTSPP